MSILFSYWVRIGATSLANLYPEEPDAGNPHVRICGGAGESNLPGLLDPGCMVGNETDLSRGYIRRSSFLEHLQGTHLSQRSPV